MNKPIRKLRKMGVNVKLQTQKKNKWKKKKTFNKKKSTKGKRRI